MFLQISIEMEKTHTFIYHDMGWKYWWWYIVSFQIRRNKLKTIKIETYFYATLGKSYRCDGPLRAI